MKVTKQLVKLNDEQKKKLSKLIVSAFGNESDLDLICYAVLDVRNLRHIAAPAGLIKMVIELLTWSEDEQKLPELLNAMMAKRPGRSDIRDFIKGWADAGIFELAE